MCCGRCSRLGLRLGLSAAIATQSNSIHQQNASVTAAQVRGYLESVYKVSAQPEEYVKYRLHLVTRLEMRQINDWFHNRCGQPT